MAHDHQYVETKRAELHANPQKDMEANIRFNSELLTQMIKQVRFNSIGRSDLVFTLKAVMVKQLTLVVR